jgi:hypothetical protein
MGGWKQTSQQVAPQDTHVDYDRPFHTMASTNTLQIAKTSHRSNTAALLQTPTSSPTMSSTRPPTHLQCQTAVRLILNDKGDTRPRCTTATARIAAASHAAGAHWTAGAALVATTAAAAAVHPAQLHLAQGAKRRCNCYGIAVVVVG